jgi:hypothetical protein
MTRFHEVHDGLEDLGVAVLQLGHRVPSQERGKHLHEVVAPRRLAEDAEEDDPQPAQEVRSSCRKSN